MIFDDYTPHLTNNQLDIVIKYRHNYTLVIDVTKTGNLLLLGCLKFVILDKTENALATPLDPIADLVIHGQAGETMNRALIYSSSPG